MQGPVRQLPFDPHMGTEASEEGGRVTDQLPAPLVSADVDLSDFPRMPFDVARLRRSKAWLIAKKNPELGFYMLNLWMAAWHESPPGSLDDDDEMLAEQAMCKESRWGHVREQVLRNWVKCTDGRLYHPTVVEMVEFAWKAKVAQRERTRAATEAREAKRRGREAQRASADVERDEQRHDQRDVERDESRDVHQEKGSSREGKGREGNSKKKPSASSATPTIPCPYDRIVDLYHELLPTLPRATLMQPPRQKALRKVWGWILSSKKSDGSRRASTAEEAIEWLRAYFRRAADNDFLMGRTAKAPGHENWECDLDFLLTDKGMKQVIEKTREAA
jgi:hypothetical protein